MREQTLISHSTAEQRSVSSPKLSKLELDSDLGLSSRPVLIPLHPSDSQRIGVTDHPITFWCLQSPRYRVSAACLSPLDGKSAVSPPPCHYSRLLCFIYLFPFINNSRKQRCIHLGNKYPSLCECHKFFHDMKAHILSCLHYVRKGFFFGHYGIKCSRNAHRHRLKKRWS